MDPFKRKERKGNLIIKAWERCTSIRVKGKSWPCPQDQSWYPRGPRPFLHFKVKLEEEEEEEEEKRGSRKCRVAPEGCFSVYVGPQKQRFVIKTEYVNHPLFKLLLEEAESEYGFHSEGPLVLPCKVEEFLKVLLAVDDHHKDDNIHQGCGFAKGYGSYCFLGSSPIIAINQF